MICGREHRHGRPANPREALDGERRGHRSAHCKSDLVDDDAPEGYYLTLADDVEFIDGELGKKERTRIQREEGYVWLDDGLGRENISRFSTRRLEYVLRTLDNHSCSVNTASNICRAMATRLVR